jgi:hypothetical protein
LTEPAPAAGPAARPPRHIRSTCRNESDAARLDRFEIAALAALAALSVAVLAGLLVRVWARGGVLTGSDGFLVVDQLQYLNWLRQAGDHATVENLYDLAPGPSDFLHPGVLVSGLLHRAGLGVVAAYMAWKPVAVVALFAGALAWTRRLLDRTDDRRLALALALFAASPVAALVGWAGIGDAHRKFQFDFLGNEMWAGNWLWGYVFTALAVAMLPLGLLAYERGRTGGRRAMLGWAAAAGLAAAWLQPWQGATYVAVLVAAEAVCARRAVRGAAAEAGSSRRGLRGASAGAGSSRRALRGAVAAARDLALPLAATAAPLAYYLVLSHVDASWELAGRANDTSAQPRWPWWVTVAGLAPLAVPAALAYRLPARRFADVALRAWPLAALAVFHQPAGTFPFHAFQGLGLPLAVLAVLAVRARLGDRPLPLIPALAAAAVMIVPGTLYEADQMRDAVRAGYQAHFMEPGERDALRALDRDPEPGGVLAPAYLGTAVPAYTGRETWTGAGSWTPGFVERSQAAEDLFARRLPVAEARDLVRRSGARFLFSDCHGRADVTRVVAGVTDPPRRFGCATVWRVRP